MAELDRLSEEDRAAAARFAAVVRAEIGGVREIIVFGSRARGDGDASSDLDVAVILEAAPFAVRREVLNRAADLTLATGIEISPTVIDESTWKTWQQQQRPLAMDISRDGNRCVTGEGVEATIEEELASVRDELTAAEALIAIGQHRIALGRVYFAVFHAICAQLYATGHEPRTHAGVRHLFDLHFVKPGTYPADTSRVIARLQKFREDADYAVSFVVDEQGAREELAAARELIARVRTALGR